MNKQGLQLLSVIGTFTTIFVAIIELSNIEFLKQNRSIIYFSLLAVLIIAFISFLTYDMIKSKKKKIVKVAILGRPATGKTVFVTVLYNELLRLTNEKYEFLIPDKKTTETVLADMRRLADGLWLSATYMGGGFAYKGLLIKNIFTKREYDLEVRDFSGEEFKQIGRLEGNWTHNDGFFKYILESQIIILTVDVSEFGYENFNIYDFIATINLLCTEGKSKKIEKPILLLFLKSDLIGENAGINTEEQVLDFYKTLIDVCNKKCRDFKYFFVSSVGNSSKEFINYLDYGKPRINNKIELKPMNVKESFLWSISKL